MTSYQDEPELPFNLKEFVEGDGDEVKVEDEDLVLEELEKQWAEVTFNATDYYALFNLNKECSAEEIKEAYKRLSRSFHPDKHTDLIKRQLAQERFQALSKAYEVLKDPNTRAIYDNYGEKALTMPWTVGPLLKTPAQMREEYERMAKRKREEEIENLIQTKTTTQFHVNATPLFASQFGNRGLGWRLHHVGIPRLVMKQTYHSQITDQISLSLTNSLLTQEGRGGGNIGAIIRHNISPKLTLEYGSTLLNSRIGTFKTFYQPTSDSFINTVAAVATPWSPPHTSITVGRRVANNVTGFMSFNSGDYSLGSWGRGRRIQNRSTLSIGLASKDETMEYHTELQVGEMQSHLSVQYKRKLTSRTHLTLTSSLSNVTGIMVGVGADHRVASKTHLGGGLDVGYPSGLMLRFSVKRLGQTLSIPISVCPELSLTALITSVAIPTGLWLAINEFAISPWRTRKLNEKLREIKELNASFLEVKRREAEEACVLLREAVARRTELEAQKNGLVILEATYGNFEGPTPLPEESTDVTVAVQNLVNESQLYIVGGHAKSQILGFYDPCFGSPKQLRVTYQFQRQRHQVMVGDRAPLVCPMRDHLVH